MSSLTSSPGLKAGPGRRPAGPSPGGPADGDQAGASWPRRKLVAAAGALLIAGPALAHTPYKQWVVYRKKHLLVLTDRSTDGSYELGKTLAATLKDHVPDSRARVARAPNTARIASLLATAQFDVALLPRDEAAALARGDAPFESYGPVDLRTLYVSGRFVLVSRSDFPPEHAYLVTQALVDELGLDEGAAFDTGVPVHPGSADFLDDA